MKELLVFNGVILVCNYPQITVFSWFVRRIFLKKYKIINYVANLSALRKHSITGLLSSLWFYSSFLCTDAVQYDPHAIPNRFIDYFKKTSICLSAYVIDTESFCYKPLARIRIRDKLGISEGQCVVGLIGPFHRYNLPSLKYLEANYSKFRNNIVFLIIGDCPNEYRFSSPRVRFVGRVEHLDEYLSACDVAMIPRFVFYGSPMGKMIYSMAVGLPVVTNTPENMDVVNGVHCLIGPVEKFPDMISRLLDDQELARAIGRNARVKIEEEFSFKANREKLRTFLRQLADSSNPQSSVYNRGEN
ncbi:MAG: glycosyltransferase family 4 protein [Conexivisphaerales archaeon]